MAKELKGWRDPRDWEIHSGDKQLEAILNISRSDDGWLCPHCGSRYSLAGADGGEGVSNEDYFNLIENCENVKMSCYECGKDYHVRCFVTKRFFSCEDDKFEG